MAKLTDKFYNRIIEGSLSDISEEDAKEIEKRVHGIKLTPLKTVTYDSEVSDDYINYIFGKVDISGYDMLILTGSLSMCFLLNTDNALYLQAGLLGCMSFPQNQAGETTVARFRLTKSALGQVAVRTSLLRANFDLESPNIPSLTLIGVKI